MRRHFLQIAATLILLVAIGSQISELLDRWDNTMQTGNDIESVLVVLALTAGAVLVAARAASGIFTDALDSTDVRSIASVRAMVVLFDRSPNSSPPLPLRI